MWAASVLSRVVWFGRHAFLLKPNAVIWWGMVMILQRRLYKLLFLFVILWPGNVTGICLGTARNVLVPPSEFSNDCWKWCQFENFAWNYGSASKKRPWENDGTVQSVTFNCLTLKVHACINIGFVGEVRFVGHFDGGTVETRCSVFFFW